MPCLENIRHERFCQLVATGVSYTRAYRQVYGAGKKSVDTAGSRLMRREGVLARVRELQREGASETALTVQAAHKYLLDVIVAGPGEIDENSPICQSYKRTETGIECKLPDKLRALELAMKLQGCLRDTAADQKTDVSGGIILTKSLLLAIQEKRRRALTGGDEPAKLLPRAAP